MTTTASILTVRSLTEMRLAATSKLMKTLKSTLLIIIAVCVPSTWVTLIGG
jgi:hypothetical protein